MSLASSCHLSSLPRRAAFRFAVSRYRSLIGFICGVTPQCNEGGGVWPYPLLAGLAGAWASVGFVIHSPISPNPFPASGALGLFRCQGRGAMAWRMDVAKHASTGFMLTLICRSACASGGATMINVTLGAGVLDRMAEVSSPRRSVAGLLTLRRRSWVASQAGLQKNPLCGRALTCRTLSSG